MTSQNPFSFDRGHFDVDQVNFSTGHQRATQKAKCQAQERYFFVELSDDEQACIRGANGGNGLQNRSQVECNTESELQARIVAVPHKQTQVRRFFKANDAEYELKRKTFSLGCSTSKSPAAKQPSERKAAKASAAQGWVYEGCDYDARRKMALERRERQIALKEELAKNAARESRAAPVAKISLQ